MRVNCLVSRTITLDEPTKKLNLAQPLAYTNAKAHAMQVVVMDEGEVPADLTGIGCTASFKRSDNTTVEPINGTVTGNVAQVILPASCYVIPGRFTFTMNLSDGNGATRTVLWVDGMVEKNTSNEIVDPGTPVGNIEQAIGNANAAASAATTAATAANTAATNAANAAKYTAPTEASSTASKAYAVGDYFVYNGKLYITTSAIASGGTITPNTNCAEITNGLSGEVGDLKSAISATASNFGYGAYNRKLDVSMLGWEFGDLYPSGGEDPSTTRLRSEYFPFDANTLISVSSGYVFTVLGASESGTIIYTSNDIGWVTSIRIPCKMNCRLLFRKSTEGAFPDGILNSLNSIISITADIGYVDNPFGSIVLGNVDPSSGGTYASTDRGITNLMPVKAGDLIWANCEKGYKFYTYYYNADGSYYGNGGTWFIKQTASMPIDGLLRLVVSKSDDSDISSDTLTDMLGYYFVRGSLHELSKTVSEVEEKAKYPNGNLMFELYGKFERKGWAGGTAIWADNTTRITVTEVQNAKRNILLIPLNGYRIAVQSWKTLTPASASDEINDSGWLTMPYVIAAGEYFTFSVSTANNGTITLAENINVIAYEFTGCYEGNVKAVAHRGLSMLAPENTASAFIMARNKGFRYVETDVQLSSDGEFVMIHDSTVNRTSDGTGDVSAKTLAQLKALDFGSWMSAKFAGEQILTLSEFLALCRKIGLYPYIELKTDVDWTDARIASLVNGVKSYGVFEQTIFTCGSYAPLEKIRGIDSKARIMFVTNVAPTDGTVDGLNNHDGRAYYGVSYSAIDTDTVSLCIANDINLVAWTVDSASTILTLNPYVSGIYSNFWNATGLLYYNGISG